MERPPVTPRPTSLTADLSAPQWDAIIAGAGPAGSILARRLAVSGARVLLLERATFPRDKTCGCCLSAAAVDVLEHAGLGDIPARLAAPVIDSLELRCGSVRHRITLAPGRALSRAALDHAMALAAVEAGAEFHDGASARLLSLGATQAVEVTRGDQTLRLHATVVIAADGVGGSFLRGHAGLAPIIRPGSRIGIAARLGHPTAMREHAITMVIAPHAYAGLVRVEDGGVHLAAGVDPAALRRASGPAGLLSPLLSRCGIDADLSRLRWHGTPPLARRRVTPEHPGLFIIGDAAAYEAPFTGEGMAWAMASGFAAAPFVLDALRGAARPAAWRRERSRLLAGRLLRCRITAAIAHHPRLAGGVIRIASALPRIASAIAGLSARPLDLGSPRPSGAGGTA